MGTKKARPNVQRTAGVDAYDRMQAWGRELAAKLDARGPVAKSAARIAADQCNSATRARSEALRLARLGDADCATWQSRAAGLAASEASYSWGKGLAIIPSGETHPGNRNENELRRLFAESFAMGSEAPRGFRRVAPVAPPESADPGYTPAEEATEDVSPTVAAVSAAVAELVPVRMSTTTRGGTSAALRRIRQGLTPQEHDRMRQEHRASAAALPSATPPPTPPAKSTGAVRKSRETPEQRDARIAAWREQNAEERERRRLAAAAEREQRREEWRRAHARPALRIVRSA